MTKEKGAWRFLSSPLISGAVGGTRTRDLLITNLDEKRSISMA
jgi:hypothetical protein